MVCIEYEIQKNKYLLAQQKYDEILSEKETLFLMTQPKAISYEISKTKGNNDNIFETYISIKEARKIDKRLREARSILRDRKKLYEIKEEELKKSTDSYDKIYKYKYIENLQAEKIGRLVGYSRSQVYNILKNIEERVKNEKK